MKKTLLLAALGAVLCGNAPAFAKSTQASSISTTATVSAPVTTGATEKTMKAETKTAAKKARSEKQLANDNLMRECGKQWRADKAAGKTVKTKWVDYLKTCRAKQKG